MQIGRTIVSVRSLTLVPALIGLLTTLPAGSAQADDAARGDERASILVMDFTATEVPDASAALVTRIVAAELAKRDALHVVAADDLRRGVALEGERVAAGCSDAACMGEIADALGARLVVFGDVGALEEDVVLTLTLFDAHTASVRHKVSRVTSHDALPDAAGDAARDVGRVLAPSPSAWPLVAGSALAVGGVAAAAGGATLAVALGVRSQAATTGEQKALAGAALMPAGLVAAGGATIGLVGAGALLWLPSVE